MLRPLIHLQVAYVNSLFFLHVAVQCSQHIYQRDYPFAVIYSYVFCHKLICHSAWVYFWTLCLFC